MWFPDRPFKGGWVKLSFQISTNDPIYNPPHYVQVIQGGNTASHQLSQVWSSGNRWETSFKLQASGNSIQLILYNEAGITNDNHTLGWIVPIRDLGDGELADSDNDGLPDEWEELYGLDPLDDGSLNPDNGANGDPDGDGLKNSEELLYGLNPIEYDDILWDADGDGIPLIVEIQRGTDPHDPDDYPEPDYLIPAGETNITTAIEQAVALNTNDYTIIQFEPGVYTYGSAGYVFEVNSDKVIFVGSMNHADPVIIDAEEAGRCITVLGNNVSISGFVLRNGVSYTTYPGGGIRAYNSRLAVNNCFFENCLADITPVGAAIYATGCNLTLVNCVFIGNGGGGKTIYTSGGTLRMRHCTMTDNDGGLDATGSLSQTPSEVDIKSSIFWNTGATPLILPQFPVPLVADSCIEGGYVGGSNIYTNDPNFVNGWRLEGAQSVDIINYTASDVIYDIDGEFRGEYADLGADEWVVDSDGDGLPDWWEIANGLDPFDDGTIDPANGYGADPDNDGWNNAQEMRAGTLATNSDTDGDGVIDSYDPEPLIFNCFIEQQISFNLQAFDKPFADGSGAPVYAGSVFATPVFPSIVATITQVRLTGHVDDCFKINNQEYAWGRASEIFQEDITDSVLDRKAGRFRVDVYDYIDNGWQNNEVHLLDSGAGPAGALCTIRYLTGLRVEVVSVDATDDIGPTKINYRVTPSGISIPSVTFTAPGMTETRANVGGDFFFTYNQSDLPEGESTIRLSYLGCNTDLTATRTPTGKGPATELVIATVVEEENGTPVMLQIPITHKIQAEGYDRITYSAPVVSGSYTLHVGGSAVKVETGTGYEIQQIQEKHKYRDTNGTYLEQFMTEDTGPTIPPSSDILKYFDSTDDRFFRPGLGLEGIARLDVIAFEGDAGPVFPLALTNEEVDQDLE